MAGVEGLTRLDIRQRILRRLAGSRAVISTTSTAGGDATSLVDNTLFGGADNFNGWWVFVPDSTGSVTNGEEVSRVDDTQIDTPASGDRDLTLRPALTSSIGLGMPYELWPTDYDPTLANDYINEAITAAVGRYYKREESVALFADGSTLRFDIPSEFNMIDRIMYRSSVAQQIVHHFESTFDETTDANFTQALDSEDKKLGQSLKITVAAGASLGDFITDSISSLDLSKYDYLEGWIKSSVALDAADYVIHLDDGTVQADGSDLESLNVPAVSADTWTYFRILLANPESDTAIISVGIEMNVDKGAHTVWFDDLKVVINDSAVWSPLPRQTWSIDREANDLVLTDPGKYAAGYSLLKILGGSNPAQMTADTDTATVPESYLINYATGLMLMSGSDASDNDPHGRRSLGRDFLGIAEREAGKFPVLQGAREV